MHFPRLLAERELGLSGAQSKIMLAMDQITADNLAKDHFRTETVILPSGRRYSISRNGDFAVISAFDGKVHSIALWSLITVRKMWDFELDRKYDMHLAEFTFSECGMVLMSWRGSTTSIIVLDGKQTGVLLLPEINRILPIGNRILGTWYEKLDPNDDRDLPEKSHCFFGEWDQTGSSLSRHQLDHTRGRLTSIATWNETFWVRLSASEKAPLASIIEVVNRITGMMKTFELPLTQEEEQFSSPCIIQNRLFYGKYVIRRSEYEFPVPVEPTICIYDLIEGRILEQFPAGAEKGTPKHIVANQNYVAWLDHGPCDICTVKYLDLLNKSVKTATSVSVSMGRNTVDLSIVGTILTVIFKFNSQWHRQVIDMSDGQLKCAVIYKKENPSECSLFNGNMLITSENSLTKFSVERLPCRNPIPLGVG